MDNLQMTVSDGWPWDVNQIISASGLELDPEWASLAFSTSTAGEWEDILEAISATCSRVRKGSLDGTMEVAEKNQKGKAVCTT